MKRIFIVLLVTSAAVAATIAGCSGTTCSGSKGSGTCFQFETPSQCSYSAGNTESCNSTQSSGHCPSSSPTSNSLIGCCVTTESVLGCTETASDCYYSAVLDGGAADPQAVTNAANAKMACTTTSVPTTTLNWTTSPP